MYELLDTPRYLQGSIEVKYSPYTAEWNVTGKNQISYNNVAAYVTYGTDRANAYRIMEDTLNLRDVRIFDTVTDPDGKERRVLNKEATEIQKEMVQDLSERAAAVHASIVDPSVDNMLKITSDGRKLGLDQRIINPLLPDDPQSKVNACVGNIYRIWDEGQDKRLTQLVFCDISTPSGRTAVGDKAAKAGEQTINGVELRALDDMMPAEAETEAPRFNVYSDIRQKLITKGITAMSWLASKAVNRMTEMQFQAEKRYQVALAIAKALLKKELLTQEEYAIIDTILLYKFQPSLGTLLSENALT